MMHNSGTAFAAAAVVAATLSISAPASAATVIAPVKTGPFSLGNSIGTIDGLLASSADTYDFTFTLAQAADTLMQLQASTRSGAQDISFTLFSGAPGSGAAVASSTSMTGPSLDAVLAAGAYYIQIDKVAVDGELVSGALALAAPAPEVGTWGLLFTGLALVGGAFRLQRRKGAKYVTV